MTLQRGSKNDICHSPEPYYEGGTNNNIKNNNTTKENNSTKTTNNNTNTTNYPRFDDNPVVERAATVGDVRCGSILRAKVLYEQTTTKKLNQMVLGIRCHAIQVLGLSIRRSFTRSTLKLPRG